MYHSGGGVDMGEIVSMWRQGRYGISLYFHLDFALNLNCSKKKIVFKIRILTLWNICSSSLADKNSDLKWHSPRCLPAPLTQWMVLSPRVKSYPILLMDNVQLGKIQGILH